MPSYSLILLRTSLVLFVLSRGGRAQGPSPEELQFLSGAIPSMGAKQWKEAEGKLKEGLAAFPRSAVLSNALGMVYHSEHRDSEAVKSFQDAIEWLPGFTAAQLHLGSLFAEENDCKQASPLMVAAASGTTDLSALATAGAGLARCGEFGSAEQVFRKAHEANPQSGETSFNLALAQFANSEYEAALDSLSTMTSSADRQRPEVLILRGRLLRATNRPGADEAFSAACLARPEEESCNEAAVALIGMERFGPASSLLTSAAQSLPRSATVLSTLGLAQFQLGRYTDSIASFKKAMEIDPKLDAPREGLGFLLYMTGDLEDARAVIEEGLKVPKPDFYLPYLHGLVLFRMGRPLWQEALKSIEAALALNRRFAPAYFLRGKIEMDDGNLESALADLQEAAATDQKYALPHYKMAQIYDRQGANAKAQRERERFAELGSLREEEVLARQTQAQVLAKR